MWFYLRHFLLWCVLALAGYWLWLDRGVVDAFEQRRWDLPARIYASPIELYAGVRIAREDLIEALSELGYRRVAQVAGPGQFALGTGGVTVHTRGFAFWDGVEPARDLVLEHADGRVGAIRDHGRGKPIALVRFEPLEIGRIHPQMFEDRVLLTLQQVPAFFVRALVAIEDRRFYAHSGVDLFGIARALWVNVRAGGIAQGGSTLTQQLVKNLYLTRQRALWRKVNEAMMALSIERRYSKQEILETYINEVFLGQDGNRAIHGFGLAAEFYFGRPLAELSVAEYALLIGMVRGPSYYNPFRQPGRALARRNVVLKALLDAGEISVADHRRQAAAPLELRRGRWRDSRRHAAFLDLVQRQLRRDYKQADLQTAGLKIFTTLDMLAQAAAERAVRDTLEALEANRKPAAQPLQAAVVVTDARTADIKALIGDREPGLRGFNRALDARRQIGSLMKPFVYLTALEQAARFNVSTPLADEPRTWTMPGGKQWTPKNYDGRYHGQVPMREALARSLNLATLDLGMRVGIDPLVDTLQRLGYQGTLPKFPSLFLGAVDMTPYDVAQLYQVLANDGFRIPLRAIRAVVDSHDQPLARYGLRVERVVDAASAFLARYLLTQVVTAGTARAVANAFPNALPLAGKTGTSDDARDSWFAGFGANALAVAWIGRDDNKPAGLTGATGALRAWAGIMRRIGIEPLRMDPPPTVEWHWVSADGTSLSAQGCPGAALVPVDIEQLPVTVEQCTSIPSSGQNLWQRIQDAWH